MAAADEAQTLAAHWDRRYEDTPEDALSWFESQPERSLRYVQKALDQTKSTATDTSASAEPRVVVDCGAGESRLVVELLSATGSDQLCVALIDLSSAALDATMRRLEEERPAQKERVRCIAEDVTHLAAADIIKTCGGQVDVWHDRACFHFLVDEGARRAYRELLQSAVKDGGFVVMSTFAPEDQPRKCSALPTRPYDALGLLNELGGDETWTLVEHEHAEHITPTKVMQPFTWVLLRKKV